MDSSIGQLGVIIAILWYLLKVFIPNLLKENHEQLVESNTGCTEELKAQREMFRDELRSQRELFATELTKLRDNFTADFRQISTMIDHQNMLLVSIIGDPALKKLVSEKFNIS